MSLSSYYQPGRLGLSFELFPPKTPAGEQTMFRNVGQLVEFGPDYITCTYGAGGSTRDKTLDIVSQVKREFDIPVASHLTCVGSTVTDLRQYLSESADRGVDYIVALRGDPPKGESIFQATDGGLRYANELVSLVRSEFPNFGIAVAGYPEKHQEAASMELDLNNLQNKVASGADIVITQLFYDNADFYRFRDSCQSLGIDVPIIPGILPVTNLSQIQRLTALCGAQLPESFVDELGQKDDVDWQFQVGVEFATRQVRELIENKVDGLHFYVLNKSQATSNVLRNAGLGRGR